MRHVLQTRCKAKKVRDPAAHAWTADLHTLKISCVPSIMRSWKLSWLRTNILFIELCNIYSTGSAKSTLSLSSQVDGDRLRTVLWNIIFISKSPFITPIGGKATHTIQSQRFGLSRGVLSNQMHPQQSYKRCPGYPMTQTSAKLYPSIQPHPWNLQVWTQ